MLKLMYAILISVLDPVFFSILPLFTEVSPQPTNFTCTLMDSVCGPPNTATILCSWEVDPGRSVIFINVELPNGTIVDIPGTQTSYSFEHSCQEGDGQDVLLASNCNNGTVEYNLQHLVGEDSNKVLNICYIRIHHTIHAKLPLPFFTTPV